METVKAYHYDKAQQALTVYQMPELSATKTGSIFGAKFPWDEYIRDVKRIQLSEGITFLTQRAFANCCNLTSVEMPQSITSIGDEAFTNCCNMRFVDFPQSITSIGDEAFANCYLLFDIVTPTNCLIAANAFSNCFALETKKCN